MQSLKVTFPGSSGDQLAARLELPLGQIRSYAVFAHCFTCSKDLFASRRIASELAMRGIAVLRFDFTGLGASGGEFANSNFSSNVEDLRRAAQYLAEHFGPAELLVGHSLGGAAVLVVAADLPDVRAVVTIGAPAATEHVIHSFRAHVPVIEKRGEAEVELAGRHFTIRRQFLEDVRRPHLEAKIHDLGRPLLVLHAPGDEIVGIENAKRILAAARHPKSFISLDGADHLLTRHEDAAFVAEVVSAWYGRYFPKRPSAGPVVNHDGVLVRASREGRFQQVVEAGRHRLLADEPESYGGLDSGPSPYDFVSAALGTCTSMTLQLYAERKGWQLPPYTVEVRHAKVHADDCASCADGRSGKIDQFERRITFEADPGPAVTEKIAEIAGKCPVHRTLEARSHIVTKVETSNS
ncbi:osmotically inducible protein C [Microvirga vignae]|uniref:Osmotically inducible protein C n=1 Tax=Microvirga vignae TaxID=1225564 RepID=A0A0H1R3T4_9HYPH|nr:bifunctional alpha/beta hydrolase/OsmC family protein [Microvirga vignae]KLK89466.1 osmotically inducible protein C [Microvirga vignae]